MEPIETLQQEAQAKIQSAASLSELIACLVSWKKRSCSGVNEGHERSS